MSRNFVSRPVQLAIADGVLSEGQSFFDYGCGRGADVRHLSHVGFEARGWDPAHAPHEPRVAADVVNLGYVVNVVDDPVERNEALQSAWALAKSVLIVAARLDWEARRVRGRPHGDGVVTATGTFQKFFRQDELRAWVDGTLGVQSVAAAPGVFYVFRSQSDAQRLLARAARSTARPHIAIAELAYREQSHLLKPLEQWIDDHQRIPAPNEIPQASDLVATFGSIRAAFSLVRRVTGSARWSGITLGARRRSDERFAANLEILQPLIDFVSDRGRLPRPAELSSAPALEDEFGSIRASFSLVRRVVGASSFTEFEERARADLLVYLALAAFGGRPKLSDLPEELQHDIKDLFGSYKEASTLGDELLFSLSNQSAIDVACRASPYGKLTPEALYVHTSGLASLSPVLRVYEGCAQTLTGTIENATVLKLHRLKPQVSFLVYPKFDRDAHPVLEASIVARLGGLAVSYKDFSNSENPPVLHRKELFVPDDYPGRAKFQRLTKQEEAAGLFEEASIGHQDGWASALRAAGCRVAGHRLLRS